MEDKRKLIVILVVVGAVVALVIAGLISQKSKAAAKNSALVAAAAANAPPPGPPTDADRAAASTALVVVTNQENDRVRTGGRMPFSMAAASAIETEGGKMVSAQITLPADSSGPIEELAPQDGKVWVMIQMDPSNKRSLLGKSVARAMEVVQPLLLDGQGQYCEPCGFFYKDMNECIVQVDPMGIVRGMSQAPRLNETRTDQSLWLVFLVPSGSEINSFWLGKKKMVEWVPNVPVK